MDKLQEIKNKYDKIVYESNHEIHGDFVLYETDVSDIISKALGEFYEYHLSCVEMLDALIKLRDSEIEGLREQLIEVQKLK